MYEEKTQKRGRTGKSLNLVLWFSFSIFALVLVVLFMAIQSFLVGKQYREQTLENLRTGSGQMTAVLTEAGKPSYSVLQQLRAIEDELDVRFRLIYPDGRNVLTDGNQEDSYPEIAETLKNHFSAGEASAVIANGSTLAYATVHSINGQTCFLYVYSSIARLNSLENGLRLLTFTAALFSVVLAFVASGFVAMLITKPVTEVTEQAKELARGHYDIDFKRDYFCSEMKELSETLDYARTEISKADSMQKELIANVSHDFKTPLTMIKAYASLIREISGDDKVKRDAHAQIIIDEADRLTSLVGDLLDLSKLRAGVGMQAPTVFNLSETLYKITDRFHYLRETQGYSFSVEAEEDLYTYADRDRIEQVLYNLIGNAANYTGDDKTVKIRLFVNGEFIRFEVEDSGKGIPEEEIGNIWQRYYRSSEAHKRPVQGTGLGLSIVESILRSQGCPFGVRSKLNVGTTFWVDFIRPPEEASPSAKEQ